MKNFISKIDKPSWNRRTALLLVILVAVVFRFYKLNVIPYGYSWDEAAIAYNAWSISMFGFDEHGTSYPISFESFGDWKAPLFIYLLAGFYKLIGFQLEFVRILAAIVGVVCVPLVYLLAKELFSSHPKVWLVSALAFSVSPWSVGLSRIGIEANLGLGLVLVSGLMLFKAEKRIKWIWPASVFFGLALYAYHSAKIFVPAFLVGYMWLRKDIVIKRWKKYLMAGCLLVLVSLPVINASIFGRAGTRAQTLIFYEDTGSAIGNFNQIGSELGRNIVEHISPSFWVGGNDAIGLRHLVLDNGAIYRSEILFLVLGLMVLTVKGNSKSRVAVWWLVAGLLPSVLSKQSPHAIRALMATPAIEIIMAMGLMLAFKYLRRESVRLAIIFLVLVSGWFLLNVKSYLFTYYGEYADLSAPEFQYGYKEAFEVVGRLGRTKDKVVVTTAYGHPYIYTLIHRQIRSKDFLSGGLANYEFRPIKWPEDQPDTLYVGTPLEIDSESELVKEIIYYPNSNRPVFLIAETGD